VYSPAFRVNGALQGREPVGAAAQFEHLVTAVSEAEPRSGRRVLSRTATGKPPSRHEPTT
jgi:hypothetical protein